LVVNAPTEEKSSEIRGKYRVGGCGKCEVGKVRSLEEKVTNLVQ